MYCYGKSGVAPGRRTAYYDSKEVNKSPLFSHDFSVMSLVPEANKPTQSLEMLSHPSGLRLDICFDVMVPVTESGVEWSIGRQCCQTKWISDISVDPRVRRELSQEEKGTNSPECTTCVVGEVFVA